MVPQTASPKRGREVILHRGWMLRGVPLSDTTQSWPVSSSIL
jgi:hypothetical protein